jgi:hypothetical protein
MITRNECMSLVLDQFVDFTINWDAYLKYWGDQEHGLCNDMTEFSLYAVDAFRSRDQELTLRILTFMEHLIVFGDEEVRTAATTCFLENIMNLTPAKLSPDTFVKHLGSKSREFCRAWDEFTGISTPGL